MPGVSNVLYRTLAKSVALSFRATGAEVWTRNSVSFGDASFPFSDVDLTFHCGTLNERELKRIIRTYSALRRAIPLLGEANFVSSCQEAFVAKNMNPLELSRDPTLASRILGERKKASPSESFVFLTRMLEADIKNLTARPKRRTRKWRRHLADCGLGELPAPFHLQTLVTLLSRELFSPLTKAPLLDLLTKYRPIFKSPHELCRKLFDDREYALSCLLLYPSYWLGIAREKLALERLSAILSQANESETAILIDQVRWDLAYGCLQKNSLMNPHSAARQIEHHFRMLSCLSPSVHQSLAKEVLDSGMVAPEFAERLASSSRKIPPFACIEPWRSATIRTDGLFAFCTFARDMPALNIREGGLAEILDSAIVKSVKDSILKGEKPEVCRHCHELERAGLRSPRLQKNEEVELYSGNLNLAEIQRSELCLELGNECDLQCLRCSAKNSSAWYELSSQNPLLQRKLPPKEAFQWHCKPGFLKDLMTLVPGLRELSFSGGEAMAASSHLEILSQIVSSGHASRLSLTYNAEMLLDPRPFFALWERFEKVHINAWIDGFFEKEPYLSFPRTWEETVGRLCAYDKVPDPVRVSIGHKPHVLSVLYLPELGEWIRKSRFKKINRHFRRGEFVLDRTRLHPFLRLTACPPRLKKAVEGKLLSSRLMQYFEHQMITDLVSEMRGADTHHASMLKVLEAIDRSRGSNYRTALPAELLDYFT